MSRSSSSPRGLPAPVLSLKTRSSGVLLHLSSLPSRHGIGDLGQEARRFADFLSDAGQSWWQMLPIVATGSDASPYMALSAFAGNLLFVSLEELAAEGLLDASALEPVQAPGDGIDYARAYAHKEKLLRAACARYLELNGPGELERLRASAAWLDEYALFRALKAAHSGRSWVDWDAELAAREPAALERARRELREDSDFHVFVELVFERQWRRLRDFAHSRGVALIGDIPIYVAHDSADVWANRELFQLDAEGRPTAVAGVPPDLFTETGQLWGNPLYRWERLAETGYAWWLERLTATLERFDAVRLDHFIGFKRYWQVPAGHKTAQHGRWQPVPGEEFLATVVRELGRPELIAEDLGVVGPDVDALRDGFDLPGMRVLQFAFDAAGPGNPHLPHNYPRRSVVYTGTHDNDTLSGWAFGSRTPGGPEQLARALEYLGSETSEAIHWQLIRLALASVADLAIVPAQDLLGLGTEARMNMPGIAEGNWGFRLEPGALDLRLAARLRSLTARYGRIIERR